MRAISRKADRIKRSCAMAAALAVGLPALQALAQEPDAAVKTLQSDINDARNLQRVFADGLTHCAELDGKAFYNPTQKRVIVLNELDASMQNLISAQVFNAQKSHQWTKQDAEERMKMAHLQAEKDKASCNLVAKLPEMVKQLSSLESRQ